jgi:hypothetical protein
MTKPTTTPYAYPTAPCAPGTGPKPGSGGTLPPGAQLEEVEEVEHRKTNPSARELFRARRAPTTAHLGPARLFERRSQVLRQQTGHSV